MPQVRKLVLGVVGLSAAVAGSWLWLGGRDRPPRVVLIGLDGADWNVMAPLLERGELPHLSRLIRDRAGAPCTSYMPTMSPQVWTTIVTGKNVAEHGVDWFAVRLEDESVKGDMETEKTLILITSRHRKVPALWDILGQAGFTRAPSATGPRGPPPRSMAS